MATQVLPRSDNPQATLSIASPLIAPTTPTPDPTRAADTRQTELYIVQSGDTLDSIALEYGATAQEVGQINGLIDLASIQPGDPLNVPLHLDRVGPSTKLLPDSEFVYGPSTIDFDIKKFVDQTNGYLKSYTEELDGQTLTGAQIVQRVAEQYSVNPRLLLAVIDYRGGWLSNATPDASSQYYPAGHHAETYAGLYQQLAWAANQLNDGYYGWRGRAMMTVRFNDFSRARIGVGLNAGTAGAEEFLARDDNFDTWQKDIGSAGLMATYQKWFGDPFQYSTAIVSAKLIQPPLSLPWPIGEVWYYTGGPHGGWASGSGWAAIDFTPPDMVSCFPSEYWVVAMSAGLVVRSEMGEVMVDLDGDGHEQTGWAILYMHIADQDRVSVGTKLNAGDHIGHPSCTGGAANATHVHIARRYNGEWIPAGGSIPLILDGWKVTGEATEYDGGLVSDDQVKVACECRDEAKNGIIR
ncbi:MAG TPA: LysM peptidoglycan-binding domain-containing protein [Anaerolineae bacterium]|nr:LysM peptidoglycan-binding domain-containing protein [Anaerolineae bacterium]